MKNLIVTLLTFFLCFGLANAQSNDEILKKIRAEYKIIQANLTSYKKIYAKSDTESTEGGEVISFFDKNEIKLIKTISYWETGKNITQYYFKNQKLFFVFDQNFKYNRPIYWDKKKSKENGDSEYFNPKKTKISADRYYFDNENLFLWLDNDKKNVDLNSGTNTIVGKGLIAHAHKLQSELKK